MRNVIYILGLSILVFAVSCKSKVPENIIDRDTFIQVLAEVHLADAMASQNTNKTNSREKQIGHYYQQIFKKYGTSKENFNASMRYYMSSQADMIEIYDATLNTLSTQKEANHK